MCKALQGKCLWWFPVFGYVNKKSPIWTSSQMGLYIDSRVKSRFSLLKSVFKMRKTGIKNTFDAGVYIRTYLCQCAP